MSIEAVMIVATLMPVFIPRALSSARLMNISQREWSQRIL